ncbi:uncharacterized protein LOC134531718 [Bacillus rossius redtenbacheri]|uniref:uncharacterized protein LOC134531718 n=1 Tax=Bacillus rossius redtenbacheri TaxID=93214 RepID=UPI002FDE892E
MILKRNMVTVILIFLVFCFGIFILYGQLGDDKEKMVLVQPSKDFGSEKPSVMNHTEDKEEVNGPDVRQDDPRLVARLLKHFIIKPPPQEVPYFLNDADLDDTSMGQSKKILNLVNYKKNGFFVECGALDGETRSNTLVFERTYGWSGLLIEADPSNFAEMVKKNRKAFLSPTCLSIKPHPMKVSFKQAVNIGKISDYPAGYRADGYVDVQCFPLYTYLLALNRTTVDYFSLDVEGNELDVLKTIPFDKVDIRTLSVEFFHVKVGEDDGKSYLREFMESKGYDVDSEVTHENNLANDFIFYKRKTKNL